MDPHRQDRPMTLPGPVLVVLIGASGAGKSTFAQENFVADQIISSDTQAATPAAMARLDSLLDQRLAAGLTTVIDAANTCTEDRMALAARATRYGVRPVAIVLRTPLRICLARQRTRQCPPAAPRRGRWVPEHVVRAQHHAVAAVAPGALSAEGYLDVLVLAPDPVTGVWPVGLIRPYAASGTGQAR